MNSNDNFSADVLAGAGGIAEFLGLPVRTVYRAIESKQLPHFRLGVRVYGSKTAIAGWIAEQSMASTQKAA